MKTLRRTLCVLLVVSALTAACGDDEDDPPTTTPTSTQTTTRPAPATTVPATVAQRATDGAVCTQQGARGQTEAGLPLVCTNIAGGNELRWRPA